MLVDWFTIVAQTINFLILLWLMKRFLYHPILKAIDAREAKIAAELASAATKEAEAQTERDEFQRKNDEFEQQRATLFSQAAQDATAERQRLFDEARKSADELNAKRHENLRSDAASLNQAIALRAQAEVFAIARKVLADLASTSLEERVITVFTDRIRAVDGEAKQQLATVLQPPRNPVIVRSAFPVSAEGQASVRHALNETFSADIPVQFETTPELVCGIELTTNGQKLAWSIADYLATLQASVSELLNAQGKSESVLVAKARA